MALGPGPEPLTVGIASVIKTARLDNDLMERRLKIAQRDHEARHGKAGR